MLRLGSQVVLDNEDKLWEELRLGVRLTFYESLDARWDVGDDVDVDVLRGRIWTLQKGCWLKDGEFSVLDM